MSTTEHPIIVGVFKEETRAKDAIGVFMDAGFGNDQISFVTLKGNEKSYSLLANLMNFGLSEEEVGYYKAELEAGRSIVVIRHDGRRSEALAILLLNGARNHKYLKMDEHASKEPSNISASARKGLHDQLEASQYSLFTSSSTHDREALTGDETASLQRLLGRVGLDHLL